MGDDNDKTKDVNSANAAVKRLDLISSHVAPKSKAKQSKKNRDAELPADWSDVLGELDLVRKFARTPKYETTGYIRQKEAGKLWVRERIELLLDPGTFEEVGSAAGTATWSKPPGPKHSVVEEEKEVVTDFTPSNNVQGMFTLCNFSVHTRGLTVLL
jgi:acetyl-CoA carboxylase carboxyltransferase component